MLHLTFLAAVVAAAVFFALLEIQIEGDQGWASALPTWRIENRWTRSVLGARAITGYHLYVHLFVAVMAHLPFALGITAFTLAAEFRILAFLALFWVLEDFFWFVFNPAYGVGRFRRSEIWWHAPDWWWIMPRDYWIFLPLGAGLYVASVR